MKFSSTFVCENMQILADACINLENRKFQNFYASCAKKDVKAEQFRIHIFPLKLKSIFDEILLIL